MTLNLTRGGLTPAKLINLATNDEVKFMFNPFEYALTKTNTWETEAGKGVNVPIRVFGSGGAVSLSLTLHFDSLKQGTSVTSYTDPLWKMMMVDTQNVEQRSGKGSPPAVAFSWGRLYFKAIITTMTQKYTLFAADGTPLRAEVTVSLEQYVDEGETPPQIPGQGAGQGASNSATVVEGDRMDHIASASGSDHRTIASNNNINNPLNVPAGTSLHV